MSKDSDFQPSRRQLLSQGVNASLGLIFLPQLLSEQSKPLEQLSLLSLATIADSESTSTTINQRPITVTIHFTAQANKAEALTEQLTKALPDARKAPGCRYAQLYTLAENPDQVILFKGWDSRSVQAKYLQLEQSSGRLDQLLDLVEGEPMLEYWEFQSH